MSQINPLTLKSSWPFSGDSETKGTLIAIIDFDLPAMVTGVFSRVLLALGAVSGGAGPAMGTLLLGVVLPGLFLDLALLSLAYFPARLLGLEADEMTLQPGRY